MNTLTHQQIALRYKSGLHDVDSLIAPLIELSHESASLIIGYGITQSGIREDMIPYFHVCGERRENTEPIRVLLVGGWTGTESITPYVVARVLASLESRLRLVTGLEITAFPAANLEAHRQKTFLASDQNVAGLRCWDDSSASHIQVLENEMRRQPYDLVILLREDLRASEATVEAWLVEDEQKNVLSDSLRRLASAGQHFLWKVNPVRPAFTRSFTPMPGYERQPAEIIIGLPGARSPEHQAQEGLGLILSLAHAVREAREEDLL